MDPRGNDNIDWWAVSLNQRRVIRDMTGSLRRYQSLKRCAKSPASRLAKQKPVRCKITSRTENSDRE